MDMWQRYMPVYSDDITRMWWYQPDSESCLYVIAEMATTQLVLLRYKLSDLSDGKYTKLKRELSRMATRDALGQVA